MYEGDSFFTLSLAGQFGLAVLSGLVFALMVWLAYRFCRGLWGVLLALVLFYLFVWLSPQVYYQYYRVIIDGLPQQWVIRPTTFQTVLALLGFYGPSNLSAHGQGLLGWVLVLIALWRLRQKAGWRKRGS